MIREFLPVPDKAADCLKNAFHIDKLRNFSRNNKAALGKPGDAGTNRRVVRKPEGFTRNPQEGIEPAVAIGVVEYGDRIGAGNDAGQRRGRHPVADRQGGRDTARTALGKRRACGTQHQLDDAPITPQPAYGDVDRGRSPRSWRFGRGARRRSCQGQHQSRAADPKTGNRGHNCNGTFRGEAGDASP